MIESTSIVCSTNNNIINITNSAFAMELDSVQNSVQRKVDGNHNENGSFTDQRRTAGIENRTLQDTESRDDIENEHHTLATTSTSTSTSTPDDDDDGFCWLAPSVASFQPQDVDPASDSEDDDDGSEDDDVHTTEANDDTSSYVYEAEDESAMEERRRMEEYSNYHSINYHGDDDESSCTTVPLWIDLDANESIDVMDRSLFSYDNESIFMDWWSYAARDEENKYIPINVPEWITINGDGDGCEVDSVGVGSLFSFGDESWLHENMADNHRTEVEDNNEEEYDDVDLDDDNDSSQYHGPTPPAYIYTGNDNNDNDDKDESEYDGNDDDSLFTFADKDDKNLFFSWVAAAKNRMMELEKESRRRLTNDNRRQQQQYEEEMISSSTKAILATKDITLVQFLVNFCDSR